MRHRAPRFRPALLALAALGALLVLPVPASAGLYHPQPPSCTFGADGSYSPSAIIAFGSPAFQQSTERLYVPAEDSPGRLYGYDASSPCPAGGYPPLPGFGPLSLSSDTDVNGLTSAVDNSAAASVGNLYITAGGNTGTADSGSPLLGYDAAAAPLPGFPKSSAADESFAGVGVDPGGNVWAQHHVVSGNRDVIDEYSTAGVKLDRQIDVTGLTGLPTTIDFDAAGDLYLGGNGLWKFSPPDYASPIQISPLGGWVAVDRSNGDVYLATDVNGIYRYDSGGRLIEHFTPIAGSIRGIAIDEATKALYVLNENSSIGKVAVIEAYRLPDLDLTGLSDLADTSVTLNGTVDPDGLDLTGCEFQYVGEAAYRADKAAGGDGFSDLSSGGSASCAPGFGTLDKDGGPQSVAAAVSGLAAGVRYRYRLTASNANGANASPALSLVLAKPGAETVGSPLRATTTARLDARVDPHGIPTTYHFDYLTDAAYQANLAASDPPFDGAQSTADGNAGAGGLIRLVSSDVSGLAPDTTYHYRVVADNGAFGGPQDGGEMTLATRASEQLPNQNDTSKYPGPPDSDRAWELVSAADGGGVPVSGASAISAAGDRAVYKANGGFPGSSNGTFYDYALAARPPGEHPGSGWQTLPIWPSRSQAPYGAWRELNGDDSLSTLLGVNLDLVNGGSAAGVWRLSSGGGAPQRLYDIAAGNYGNFYLFSDNGSRALVALEGSFDSAHPTPGGVNQLYDVSTGAAKLADILPGGAVAGCGVPTSVSPFELPLNGPDRAHWLSPDGSLLFFPSAGNGGGCSTPHLYLRDLGAQATIRADGPPLTGPDCSGALIRADADAAYIWTQSRLDPADTAITGSCAATPTNTTKGGDVYRFDLSDHSFKCLTCGLAGGEANVYLAGGARASASVRVPAGGSRVYFSTFTQLLPGTPDDGEQTIYRVSAGGDLAYIAPGGLNAAPLAGGGRYLAFASDDPALDALTSSNNGITAQDYLYDDQTRSLICASCPADGAPPRGPAQGLNSSDQFTGPDPGMLADDGTLAFSTPTALVDADQNTAAGSEAASRGADAYEFRDGRAILASDGKTDWPDQGPQVQAVDSSGRDLFFTAAASYTADALDDYRRLYDARIGGGIDFPPASLPPCDPDTGQCEGLGTSPPDQPGAGSAAIQGPGNPAAKFKKAKKKKHHKKKHKAKKHHKAKHKRAKHHRRAAR